MDAKYTTNSVVESVKKFIKNPDGVGAYVDFCDFFVEKGYNLKDAIDKTDNVFSVLSDKETYKN